MVYKVLFSNPQKSTLHPYMLKGGQRSSVPCCSRMNHKMKMMEARFLMVKKIVDIEGERIG